MKPAHKGVMVSFAANNQETPVIFVRGALPHELVQVRIIDRRKNYWSAHVVDVIDANPHRTTSWCPAAHESGAGCCDYHFTSVDYSQQLKTSVLQEFLHRNLKFQWDGHTESLSLTKNWRIRSRFHVDAGGKIGIRKYHSNSIVPDLRCPQHDKGLISGLKDLTLAPQSEVLVTFDHRDQQHIAVKIPHDEARKNDKGPRSKKPATSIISGTGISQFMVSGREFNVPIDKFWQAHTNAPHRYIQHIMRWITTLYPHRPPQRIWDLYCGVGLYALLLADQLPNTAIVGVDVNPLTTHADAQVQIINSPVITALRKPELLAQLGNPDLIIADPPRSGAEREVITRIAASTARAVIHIGCDVATFTRDLGYYLHEKFTIAEIIAIDAFPGTHHCEALALLLRD